MLLLFGLRKKLILPFLVLILFFGFGNQIFAQIPEAGVYLETKPSSPPPYSTVGVFLNAYTVDTAGAQISWYLNGVELTNFKNERSASFVTGALGTEQSVRVLITKSGSLSIPVSTKVSPVVIDVVLEANTYTPSFYRGRALPSAGSLLRAIAIVNDGTNRDNREYSYAWEYNGSTLFGGSIRGKQVAELTMPPYQDNRLTVSVLDNRGILVGKKTVVLSPQEPEILFYEDNPLRGLNRKAISNQLFLIGDETTVSVEPLFLDLDSSRANVLYQWRLDGEVVNSNSNPRTITLRRSGDSGQASLGLRITSDRKLPLYLSGNLKIVF